ncbi:MAG: DUF2520 domain-containing protein [Sandaracinaceae bacterium]|nr:DUF2520 domain-containing protein [Sandaracinaceae bacterium]
MKIAIVGRGRVGRGLASALGATKHSVRLVPGRQAVTLPEKTILLAVPDPSIANVAARLELRPEQSVLHCSGSLGAEVLGGASVGVMHPLVSFAEPSQPPRLEGTSFVIAGEARAVERARKIARAVGARAVFADVHGPTYHAAAALSANGAAALAAIAVRVFCGLGFGDKDARRAIGALLRTVGENVERVGLPRALSGPVIRGDDGTVHRHRVALEVADPEARAAYDAIAPAILDCARRAGLPDERAAAVLAALARTPR